MGFTGWVPRRPPPSRSPKPLDSAGTAEVPDHTFPLMPLTAADRARLAALLGMYRQGWFPMAEPDTGKVRWVQPRMRGVIPLDERFHVPRTLAATVRSGRFEIVHDRAFGEVIRACAQAGKGREDTWLTPEIIDAFELLHRAGLAHSVEAWREGRLVGGLYGVALGRVFCGESMFSRPALGGRDASKVCLVHLVEHLRRRDFVLLDAQLSNPHLEQFGMEEMPREGYLRVLAEHGAERVAWAC